MLYALLGQPQAAASRTQLVSLQLKIPRNDKWTSEITEHLKIIAAYDSEWNE